MVWSAAWKYANTSTEFVNFCGLEEAMDPQIIRFIIDIMTKLTVHGGVIPASRVIIGLCVGIIFAIHKLP